MIRGGYKGKIIRVNLSDGSITTEGLPEENVLRKHVGGFSLGLWYLVHELPRGTGPLDPENPLIFMNGPLVGTATTASNNCTITTLNGSTGFTVGRSHSHGWFGPFLAMAGYDGLIVTGASDKWVYLWINDDKIELRDAEKLLDKDTHETEDLIKEELGLNKKVGASDGASVAAIGPSGENLCSAAGLWVDKNHGFSHSGAGMVAGSKRLKAIAVRGTGKTPVFDASKVSSLGKEWRKMACTTGWGEFLYKSMRWEPGRKAYLPLAGPDTREELRMREVGELVKHDPGEPLRLSVKNWLVTVAPPGHGTPMEDARLTIRPCYRCPIGCSYDIEVTSGPYKGLVATLTGGGEGIESASTIMGVSGEDMGAVWYIIDLMDRLGLEGSEAGCSIAVAMEAYEKGLLTREDTDGLDLTWGNIEAIITLLNRIARRDGRFGQMLADGPKASAERVGLPNAAIHIKGSGLALHDWRRTSWGVLLGQIAGSGAGWTAPGADCATAEPDAGYPQKPDPLNPFGKGKEVARTGKLKFWHDCHGVCWFNCWGVPGILKLTSEAVAAAVGWEDFSPEEALAVGHRSITLERIFNMSRGLTADDDIKNVSPRVISPVPDDAEPHTRGKSIAPYLEGMVQEYYEELGWDRKTGKPLRSTLLNLGLEEYLPQVWG